MKTNKYNFNKYSLLLVLGFIFFSSCNKEVETAVSKGDSQVMVSLASFEFEDADVSNEGENQSRSNGLSAKTQTLAYGKDMKMEVTLERDSSSMNNAPRPRGMKAAAVTKPLEKGVQYRLLVYNENGTLNTSKIYTYGNEQKDDPILLDAGKTYTFVAFSINDKKSVPMVSGEENLSTATIPDVKTALMYFYKELKLVDGVNLLNIVLKHKFSAVTTSLNMNPNMTGAITEITSPMFTPTSSAASLKLSNGTLTYGAKSTAGITFPKLPVGGLRYIKSEQTFIISPNTTTAKLNFGKLIIDDEPKSNYSIENIKFVPGARYNLNITFQACTKDVTGAQGLNWDFPYETDWYGRTYITKDGKRYYRGDVIDMTITAPAADYGFVFDITELDNSMNMELNNVTMAKQEIQFEKGASSPQNIRFKDGSYFQGVNVENGKTVPAIYNLRGAKATPMVKVVISKLGEVRLFASKENNGPLYELELFNGNTFNKFEWNKTGQNVVKITQKVDQKTVLKGYGSGKTKIPCSK
ncbi:hypothetical protein [Sphingobacterium kyonggiense]